MDAGDSVHRLHLDDDALLDDEIGPEGVFGVDAVIGDPDQALTFRSEAKAPQLARVNRLVQRLEETWPERAMRLYGDVDDGTCYLVHLHARHLPRCDWCRTVRMDVSLRQGRGEPRSRTQGNATRQLR